MISLEIISYVGAIGTTFVVVLLGLKFFRRKKSGTTKNQVMNKIQGFYSSQDKEQ